MEHNFIYEVRKNNKTVIKGMGFDEDIKVPLELKITIEEETFNKIKNAADIYKLPTFEVIEHLLSYKIEDRIREYEMILQGIEI